MELYKAIWSGIVNGFVDLSPLSSGAHFEIYKMIIPDSIEKMIALLAMSCFGSLVALLFYFRREYAALFRKSGRSKLVKLLVLALPACVTSVVLPWLVEAVPFILDPFLMVAFLLASGLIVANFDKLFRPKGREKAMTKKSALVLGLASMLSVFPGLSRIMLSTLTGWLLKIKEGKSLRYGILASAPVFLATFIRALFLPDAAGFFGADFGPLVLANLVSFVVTLFVLRFIMRREEKKVMRLAAWYQIMLGLFVLFFELIKI
jgi:undecaprenyl pyrophosphate phosphatase UppP